MIDETWLDIFLFLSMIFARSTETASCPQSRHTVRSIPSCPKSREEWEHRANIKQCSLVREQCINNGESVYHCVINSFVNETLEVCAPKVRIIGRSCVEYNVRGAIIQESPYIKCSNSCPFSYTSTDAYKYQDCFKMNTSKNRTDNWSMPTTTASENSNFNSNISRCVQEDCSYHVSSSWQIIAVLMIVINVILFILIIYLIIRIKGKRKNGTAYVKKNEEIWEEAEPMIGPNKGAEAKPEVSNNENQPRPRNGDKKGNVEGLYVAAVDIGDKYVTMALSYPDSPKEVKNLGDFDRMSVLLDNKSKKPKAIGDDATQKYISKKEKNLKYFDRFKLRDEKDDDLYNYVLSRLLKKVEFKLGQQSVTKEMNILYVFVVPNYWTKADIERLEKEINKIKGNELKHKPLCIHRKDTLWPFIHEVNARVLCLNFNVDNLVLRPDAGITAYGILHIGSSHCHFTVLPIDGEDKKPCHKRHDWGKSHLPETYILSLLENIYGKPALVDWEEKHNEEYVSFFADFEKLYREVNKNKNASKAAFNFETTQTLLKISYEKGASDKTIQEAMKKIKNMKIKDDKRTFKINGELLKSCFEEMLKEVRKLIGDMKEHLKKMKCVVITGAYSDLEIMLAEAEEVWFKDMPITIAVPENLHVFAMGGAYYGQKQCQK